MAARSPPKWKYRKGNQLTSAENSQAEQIPVEVSGVVTALHGGKEHGGAGDFSDGMQENRQQGAVGDKGEGDMSITMAATATAFR